MARLPLVVWFSNNHEHSLHYLKFGLMHLAAQGEIRLQERPTASAEDWLCADLRSRQYRRIVLVGLEWNGQRKLLAVDGEDSPFQLSDLLSRVDLYYTCTYCPYLYQERQFRFALPWQTEAEIVHYHQRFEEIVSSYGDQFTKLRAWAPIGPDLEWPRPQQSRARQRLVNLRHKVQLRCTGTLDWIPQFERFSARWSFITDLRTLAPSSDVVLLDSLWGWPRHRIGLHRQLVRLANEGYAIRSCLNYRQPYDYELGEYAPPDPHDFPMLAGEPVTGNYEQLLASSRLGVFATGFHYGWRSIVTLAWVFGLKTVQDPFTYTFLFDASPFYQPLSPEGWVGLRPTLDAAQQEPAQDRQKRWQLFDQQCGPVKIARQMLEQILSEIF